MFIVSPSVLACDLANLAAETKKVENAGAQYIHLDVMDGIFVPNMSFAHPVIACLRKRSDIVFDTHLMITKPERFVDDFIKAGADIITVHYEACEDLMGTIKHIKEAGVKAAVAIKPATPASVLFPILRDIDMALVMTVEPGFGGQKMIPATVEKVREIRQYAIDNGINIDIQVDGGINADNLKLVTEAGANVVVAGSAIFLADDPSRVIAEMKEQAEKYPFGSGLDR
ncbi:MAG: ribulose-phosphate 3-epimerase [Clostridia bacterium]|nr:ribulose-phosphate 3-epimerase [Clostridia bacterium]